MIHLVARRLLYVVLFFTVIAFTFTFLPRILNPTPPSPEEKQRNQEWVNTSPYWLDRQACRWLSLCGALHVKWDPPTLPARNDSDGELRRLELRSPEGFGEQGTGPGRDERWFRTGSSNGKELKGIPDYVLKFAPLVHLYSGENFWPSDIADHIEHMLPFVNNTQVNRTESISLKTLHELDSEAGFVYLKSADDVERRPEWLHSRPNEPAPFKDNGATLPPQEDSKQTKGTREGSTWYEADKDHPVKIIADPRKRPSRGPKLPPSRSRGRRDIYEWGDDDIQRPISLVPQHKPDAEGYSRAPATLVLVDKGSGIVDAFWFFFYAYNLGQTVLGIRFGNHVGDWEHAMIRFESGVPRGVFFSEHEGGQAYSFGAVEKRLVNYTSPSHSSNSENAEQVQRPVIYSAVGSHAMYATPGDHAYVLPFHMLKDVTDRGPLWDPSKNIRSYWYDYTTSNKSSGGLEPTAENPDAETDWFHYAGPWGDRLYGLDDKRQWRLFGQYHYVTGPVGPKFKNLGREKVCQNWRCRIIYSLEEGRKKSWHS